MQQDAAGASIKQRNKPQDRGGKKRPHGGGEGGVEGAGGRSSSSVRMRMRRKGRERGRGR